MERQGLEARPGLLILGACGFDRVVPAVISTAGSTRSCCSFVEKSQKRSQVRRIAISGLVALAAVLGGVAVPATAMAQPTAAARPTTARPTTARPTTALAPQAAGEDGLDGGPLVSCALTTD